MHLSNLNAHFTYNHGEDRKSARGKIFVTPSFLEQIPQSKGLRGSVNSKLSNATIAEEMSDARDIARSILTSANSNF